MLGRISKCIVVLFTLFTGLFAGELRAEPAIITIDGLTFYCPTCVQVNEHDCQVTQAGAPVLIACSEILDYVLTQAVANQSQHPSKEEILSYLKNNQVPHNRAAQLFWLLTRSENGHDEFIFNVRQFTRMYPRTIEELVNEGWGTREILKALWEVIGPSSDNGTLNLKTAVAVQSPDYELADLIDGLSVTNIVGDQLVLKTLEQYLQMLGSGWVGNVQKLRKLLVACSEVDFNYDTAGCSAEQIAELQPNLQVYLKRVHIQHVLSKITAGSMDVKEKLRLLATTPYHEYRTPETHKMLQSILDEIERGEADVDWKELRDSDIGEMLAVFAVDDQTLMRTMSRLISSDAARKQKDKTAEKEYERAKAILPKVKAGEGARPSLFLPIAVVVVVVCSLFSAHFVWLRLSRAAAFRGKEPENLTPIRDGELTALRMYFGLEGEATSENVKRRYRKKARELHPDVEGGDASAFAELNEKYQRILELLGNGNSPEILEKD